MSRYSVGGRSAASSATTNHAGAALWNPSSTVSLLVRHIGCFITTDTLCDFALVRTSTRGTPGSTITPDADNDFERVRAPPSGAVLDLADFSVEPTVQPEYFKRTNFQNVLSSGFIWDFEEGVEVPAGTGLACVTASNTTYPASDFYFTWDE